jgi:hypothetical protein
LTWNTAPYNSKPLKSAVFAFADGDKLKARFTTNYLAFEAVYGLEGREKYLSEMQSLMDQNNANGIDIGKFEVQRSSDSTRFFGTMSPVQINQGYDTAYDPPYQDQGQFDFNAQKRETNPSPETNPSSNSNSNTGATGGDSDI